MAAARWSGCHRQSRPRRTELRSGPACRARSEEHTSELQSRPQLVCRPPLEKKHFMRLAHHTYAVRYYAYDRNSPIAPLDKPWHEPVRRAWTARAIQADRKVT